jgi:hypothetical protein
LACLLLSLKKAAAKHTPDVGDGLVAICKHALVIINHEHWA